MSDVNQTVEGAEEGVDLPSLPLPEITYRGPQHYARVDTPFRNVYEFSESNDYTVTPFSWEDFYFIIGLDGQSIARNYVLAQDPSAKNVLRRMSAIDREEVLVPEEIYAKQREVDAEHEKNARLEAYKNEYKRNINLQIMQGILDHIPETLEQDAEDYAKFKVEEDFKIAEEPSTEEPLVPEEIPATTTLEPTLEPTVENPLVESGLTIIPETEENKTETLSETAPLVVDPTSEVTLVETDPVVQAQANPETEEPKVDAQTGTEISPVDATADVSLAEKPLGEEQLPESGDPETSADPTLDNVENLSDVADPVKSTLEPSAPLEEVPTTTSKKKR